MEFIPADDEKGPGLRLKHKGRREAGPSGQGGKRNQPKRSPKPAPATGRASKSPSVRTSRFGIGRQTATLASRAVL